LTTEILEGPRIVMATKFTSWLQGRQAGTDAPRGGTPSTKGAAENRFHAVSIRPGDNACLAALQFGNMRFLSAKAPSLPLPGCDVPTCGCRYAHHSDRRSGTDRRARFDWNREKDLSNDNRRSGRGRRSTDPVA
jgi:hypothetical protein